jgi:hypothetical protein
MRRRSLKPFLVSGELHVMKSFEKSGIVGRLVAGGGARLVRTWARTQNSVVGDTPTRLPWRGRRRLLLLMRMRWEACPEIEHPWIIIVATAIARVRVDVGSGMVRRRGVRVGIAGATATSAREDVVAVGPKHGGGRIFWHPSSFVSPQGRNAF